jgi:sulfur-carrier protein
MQVVVQIPASLRQFSAGARELCVDVEAPLTVGAVFERLRTAAPGVAERALDEQGTLRPHVNVFVDGESIRAGSSSGLNTPVRAGAEVWILPAVSGGAN